jgi:GT2 family glycosyltransferase
VSDRNGATPAVSVVIPARNAAATLPPLLLSLEAQTLEPDRFEVIVVDNDSSDDTGGVASAHGVKVVHEPVANRSRARNRGVAAASAPLYAFTDADCVADPRWLEELLRCAPSAPLVAGRVQLTVGEHPNALERFDRLWRFGQHAWVGQGWASTANLLVSRAALEAVGGFDPAWREGGEDVDFCVRAGRSGHALSYCNDALVLHPGERELRPFLRRFFMHGYSINQATHRLGLGYRAWRHPLPAVAGDRALREIGHSPDGFDRAEWRRMARVARLGYAARVAGSLWAELVRAR